MGSEFCRISTFLWLSCGLRLGALKSGAEMIDLLPGSEIILTNSLRCLFMRISATFLCLLITTCSLWAAGRTGSYIATCCRLKIIWHQ